MRSILGISLGAVLAGLVTLGGAAEAPAQGGGMTNMGGSGYRDGGKAAVGYRNPARPAVKGSGYQPKPLAKGYGYRPGSRVKGAPRARRPVQNPGRRP